MLSNYLDLKSIADAVKERSLALRDQLRAAGYHKEADAYDEAYNAADDDEDGNGSDTAMREAYCACCGDPFEYDADEDQPECCSSHCERELREVRAEEREERRADERLLDEWESRSKP